MSRYYYASSIEIFLSSDKILQELIKHSEFDINVSQRNAWQEQINILKKMLGDYQYGQIIFEYDIPRLGRRIDTVLLLNKIVFVLEFKVNAAEFNRQDIEQVWDYALDLKNFQEESHNRVIVPILISTRAKSSNIHWRVSKYHDDVYEPLCTNAELLPDLIKKLIAVYSYEDSNDPNDEMWKFSRYSPTPTIIQAASYMYANHNVENITKTEASGECLTNTTNSILKIIQRTRDNGEKAICFVTGVPGAGKTLVGLNVAIQQFGQSTEDDHELAVYLSGNGPLIDVLTEALARDKKKKAKEKGEKCLITEARREVKSFIQIIHHYRNDYLAVLKKNEQGLIIENGKLQVDEAKYNKLDSSKFEGVENVAIFDEAQRAWTKEKLASWLKKKRGISNFPYSEPEFLIWSLDLRHDWSVIVCLVGGGQEINTGEAGISEWLKAVNGVFNDWKVYISPNLTSEEYDEGMVSERLKENHNVMVDEKLHLGVSMRSFRAESLSRFVHAILDINVTLAKYEYQTIKENYPIVITRSLDRAKAWLKEHARGSERYGILCSSQAYRLKPLAIDVRVNPDTVHWFLDDETDIRSSLFMEDVCTEFQVQGLELDWTCLVWDGDFRYTKNGWEHHEFSSSGWRKINKPDRKLYQKNAYRVLLTRARQGFVICVPEGNPRKNAEGFDEDPSRLPAFYDGTYEYLKSLGIVEL